MKIEKQKIVMAALATGRYSYSDGKVYVVKNGKKQQLKGGTLESGYIQVFVTNYRRGYDRAHAIVYIHILIYMMHHGIYGEDLEIDHEDRDNRNNHIENLAAKTSKENNANRKKWIGERDGKLKLIRSHEITSIRKLHGEGLSQSAIARELNLNRLSTRYIIKKIESGEALKYEHPRLSKFDKWRLEL